MIEDVVICATCAVEHAAAEGVCAICADERQWVPAAGQQWTTLGELQTPERKVSLVELEPDLYGVTVEPPVGIGQQMYCLRTPAGVLLWDPVGYLDDELVAAVRELGAVVAIAASHPHMFGLQVSWSRALGGVPVLVCEPNLEWVSLKDPAITGWSGRYELMPGVSLHQLGGHFPGSCVVRWAAGALGAGVMLSSDTIQVNPDRVSLAFMRSYPNRIPLSAAVVERITRAARPLGCERFYDNFGKQLERDGAAVLRRSADRYIGWVSGAFDART